MGKSMNEEHEKPVSWPWETREALADHLVFARAREGQLRKVRVRVLTLAGAVRQVAVLLALVAVVVLVISLVRNESTPIYFATASFAGATAGLMWFLSSEIRKTLG